MTAGEPDRPHPVVSVVIVTYGGQQWIPRALAALAANTTVPHEVIIVDNASPESTRELLRTIEGVRVVYNESNVGFGPACNQGVLYAIAPYICLLNSDAFVEPGWLAPLIEALERDPLAGAAVPCLLHLDGTLQEAGGVVGSDGSTRALGDGASASELQYRFRRYMDYGSAACLLMRREVFLRVGGFDPAYPLGYCEDVDLCFTLGDAGLRTVYEPRSTVRHVRWGSSSRHEAERRVFANQPILLARWRERLAGRPSFSEPPFGDHDILQARDADAPDRLLVVGDGAAAGNPDPGRAGWLAATIAQAWPDARVTLLLARATPLHAGIEPLLAQGVEVACSDDWEAWCESRRFHYSAVLVSGPAAFERFDPVLQMTQPQAARIFDLERLAHRCAQSLSTWWPDGTGAEGAAQAGPAGLLANRLRSLETWGVESADLVVCASREGLRFARSISPAIPAHLVLESATTPPLGGSFPEAGGFAQRSGFLAVGDLPAGNQSGRQDGLGSATLLGPLRAIVGALAGLGLGPGDAIAGMDDVAQLLGDVGRRPGGLAPSQAPAPRVLLLAPPFVSRSLSRALTQGTPFVTWRGGAEGLDLGELGDLLVADDAAGFARRARDLHEDPALWESVRAGVARLAALRTGTPGAFRSQDSLWEALAHCGFGTPRRAPTPA